MSSAVEGYNTTVASSPDGVTYTSIAEVSKISGPNMEGKEIDVTHLLSPSGFMEFIPSLVNAGEIKLDLNFVKGQYNTLHSTGWRVVLYWKITFPTGSTLVSQGFLKTLGKETPKDDKISNTVGVKWTGKPVFTP